ncbi:MAG: hypothetical protein IT372_10420 [Polyangiaceae bacterium]|nr:hypothetical protein [Polyangiaceae bacterium]
MKPQAKPFPLAAVVAAALFFAVSAGILLLRGAPGRSTGRGAGPAMSAAAPPRGAK